MPSKRFTFNDYGATLEVSSLEVERKLSAQDRANLKTRRDGSKFVMRCRNCLESGHHSLRCSQRFRVAVIGDSHSSIWAISSHNYQNVEMARLRLPGLSAIGLSRVSSSKHSLTRSISLLKNSFEGRGPQFVFIVAGKVDLDFVFYFKKYFKSLSSKRIKKNECNEDDNAKELNVGSIKLSIIDDSTTVISNDDDDQMTRSDSVFDIDDLIKESTQSIIGFAHYIHDEIGLPSERIVIHGAHLPPLNDDSFRRVLLKHFTERSGIKDSEKVKKILMNAVPSLKERTHHTLRFNQVLKQACMEQGGYLFADVSELTLDHNNHTGIVDEKYVKKKKKKNTDDIHLNSKALFPLFHRHFRDDLHLPFALDMDVTDYNWNVFKQEIDLPFHDP